ncbi:unnamed protein product [Closterium sp. NIES-53]
MSTATLAALHASPPVMSSAPSTASSSRSSSLRLKICGDIIAEELPWVPRDCHHSHPHSSNNPSAVNSSSEPPPRGARFENDGRDDEIFDDDSSHEGGSTNGEAHATPPEAGDGVSRDSSKAVRRSLAEVEMRALEGKLKLLDVQRELSSLHCQRFIHVLESTLHASKSAPTTPFPTNDSPPNHSRPSNKSSAGSDPLLGGVAGAAPSIGVCKSLPYDYYAEGGAAGSHDHRDHDLQASLPTRSFSLSLSLARSRSTPASLHNRLDSPRVRRAATSATPRSSRRHRAGARLSGSSDPRDHDHAW